MFKIMLCCSAGMSTSLLVSKMVDVAKERGLAVKLMRTAFPNLIRSFRNIRWCFSDRK